MLSGWAIAAAVLGPFMGSYIAATADRLIAGTPVFAQRSRCAECSRPLRPAELIPIVSWLALRGRCRSCGARIPARLLAVELTATAIGIASALAAPGWLALVSALLGWALLLLVLLDLGALWLPRIGGWGLAAAGLGVSAAIAPEVLRDSVAGAAAGWAILTALGWAIGRARGIDALGEGDPPLMAAAGAWVGWQGLALVFLISAVTAIVHALVGRRAQVPYGAHLALAIWLVWLAGS